VDKVDPFKVVNNEDSPELGDVQTSLLVFAFVHGLRDFAERIIASGKFTHYDKKVVAAYIKNNRG
jgi:hypothetical protein